MLGIVGQPYGGLPAKIPGTIQAEEFDLGGEGAGYHDTTPGNVRAVGGSGWLVLKLAGAQCHCFHTLLFSSTKLFSRHRM